MSTEQNQEAASEPQSDAGDGIAASAASEVVTLSKEEYAKLNSTLGSLKRDLKAFQKAQEPKDETPQTKPDESALLHKLEKMSLRQAGITHPDDVELARNTAKKWNMDIDDVLSDDDFKAKLEREQGKRANAAATSNVQGGAGTSQAKFTADYWIAKGAPPTRADVPDRKTRASIARAMMKNAKTDGKVFYND